MTREDKIIKGALDLHAHGSPEFSLAMPGRVSNVEWARLASETGMRGFVIKSHVWPTMGIASAVGSLFPDLEIYSSITLNPPAGGISSLSVELAVEAGARVVWMPTWSARQDSPHPSIFLERMQPFVTDLDPSYWPTSGLSILDEEGRLCSEVERILQICAERGVAVASGHLPISASLLLCRRSVELGAKFVLTHPLSGSVRRTSGSGGFQLSMASLDIMQCSAPTTRTASAISDGSIRWCMGMQPINTCSIIPPSSAMAI